MYTHGHKHICYYYKITKSNYIFCFYNEFDFVFLQIAKLYKEYTDFTATPHPRRTEKWKEKLTTFFNRISSTLFDIYTSDTRRRKRLELFYNVTMTQVERDFLEDQKNERKMFCENQVDRQWLKTQTRREREMLAFERQQARAMAEVKRMEKVELTDDMVDEVFQTICNEQSDMDYQPVEEEEEEEDAAGKDSRVKRRRTLIKESPEVDTCKIPQKYRHIRDSIHRVKPAYYKTIVALKSKYHCSDVQAVAAIVLTARNLFDLPWKFFDQDKTGIDLDTAPSSANSRRETRIQEILTLAEIVNKIMSGENSTITYHDDGSRTQGTGAFSVQGISINGSYHALPTLPIASESRANLKVLKVSH